MERVDTEEIQIDHLSKLSAKVWEFAILASACSIFHHMRGNGRDVEQRWERLAREDAEFYIWTDLAPDDDFYRSGERDVERILSFSAPHITRWSAALEIGCGVGRLTIPMSSHFGAI